MPRMHPHASYALTKQRLCAEFLALKHACPRGIYIAPSGDPLLWTGLIFVRRGHYANAILRFHITFPDDYPNRPPVIAFLTDVFHPLIAPLTTYTYTTRERGIDAVTAADEEKLPPGGLSLRHGFPEWYIKSVDIAQNVETNETTTAPKISLNDDQAIPSTEEPIAPAQGSRPHIVEVLQYLRIILDTEAVIDSVPLEVAANSGAWHAWRSHRERHFKRSAAKHAAINGQDGQAMNRDRSMSPKQQPGGARRPGEWNWTGVWEDRVRKVIQTSIAESTLYGGDNSDVIDFVKLDDDDLVRIAPIAEARAQKEELQKQSEVA